MSTYRDDLAAARRRIEEMSAALAEKNAELVGARARLAEHDAVLGKLEETLGERRASARSAAKRRGMALALATAGALLIPAAALTLAARLGSGPQDPASSHAFPSPSSPQPAPAVVPPTTAARSEPTHGCGGHEGYVEIVRGAETTRLTASCGPGRPGFPYAEILEKPDGTPYLIVDACDGSPSGAGVDLVGPVSKLPGSAIGVRVRLRSGRSERHSDASNVRVTRFGAVGEIVEGKFEATMRPGLNEDPRAIRGRFSVCRAADRRSP